MLEHSSVGVFVLPIVFGALTIPGATRTLVVERGGKPLVIEAKVTRFP